MEGDEAWLNPGEDDMNEHQIIMWLQSQPDVQDMKRTEQAEHYWQSLETWQHRELVIEYDAARYLPANYDWHIRNELSVGNYEAISASVILAGHRLILLMVEPSFKPFKYRLALSDDPAFAAITWH
jgi:hypothetical protein